MGEQYGGTGKQFNWELVKEVHIQKPFFLSGGIGLDDASSVLTFRDDTPLCYAVDVNSRFEIEPGIKNMGLVRQFVDSIKQTMNDIKNGKGHFGYNLDENNDVNSEVETLYENYLRSHPETKGIKTVYLSKRNLYKY